MLINLNPGQPERGLELMVSVRLDWIYAPLFLRLMPEITTSLVVNIYCGFTKIELC